MHKNFTITHFTSLHFKAKSLHINHISSLRTATLHITSLICTYLYRSWLIVILIYIGRDWLLYLFISVVIDCYTYFVNFFSGLGLYLQEKTGCLRWTNNWDTSSHMYVGLGVKCLLFLSAFDYNRNFSTDFGVSENKLLLKLVSWESRCCMRIAGRTDRHGETNSCLPQLLCLRT